MNRRHNDVWPAAQLANNATQAAAVNYKLSTPGASQPRDLSTAAGGDTRMDGLPSAARRLVLTVMFVDIRGSSRIAESLSPEGTVEFLNTYLGLAARAIVANRGGVNQFLGDGVLATFGLSGEPDRGVSNALAAAAAIHRAFESEARNTKFAKKVEAVVAIHTGIVILHAVGRAEHTRYGVLGSAVNVASRLEREGKELGLTTVISGAAVAALKNNARSLRLVTRRKLRDLSDRVEIWSPDPVQPQLSGSDTGRSETAGSISCPSASGWREAGWRRAAAVTALGAALISTFVGLVVLRPGGALFISAFTQFAYVGLAIAAAAACIWSARRATGRLSAAWTLIAASVTTWAVGQAAVGNEFGQEGQLWLPPADLFFIVAFMCAIAGVFYFWTLPVAPSDPQRALLDGLVVLVCLLGFAWVVGLKDVYLSASSDLERASQIAFPVGGTVIATVLILVINRGGRPHAGPLMILLLSVTVGVLASIFAGDDASDFYWTLANGGRLVAILLVGIAAVWPANQTPVKMDVSVDVWHLALPWMAVGLAAASAFAVLLEGKELDRFLTFLGGALAALLALSQALAHRDSLLMLKRTRQSEKTLADVVVQAPIGIARVNTDLVVFAANPSLGVLLREPPEFVIGSEIAKYLTPEMQPQMRERLQALATGGAEIVESETPLVRADGSQVWVHLTSSVVKKPTGEVEYFLTMLQDITARREAEQASRANLTELERLSKVKTEFLQSISHEFKTALIGISGFSELMRDAEAVDPEEVRQAASDIHNEAARLNQMITEFLDVDRVETSPAQLLTASVDMNAIIRREVESTKRGTDGLTFAEMLDPSLATIVGDSDKLSDLVRQLLGDAVKYSPDGGQIVITSRNHVGQVEVSVRDQGVGVRAEFDNQLFSGTDLYANNPIRRVVGTGIGLGAARQIVALHGGRIWMDRLDGIGSEAHVTLPLNLASGRAAARMNAPALAS